MYAEVSMIDSHFNGKFVQKKKKVKKNKNKISLPMCRNGHKHSDLCQEKSIKTLIYCKLKKLLYICPEVLYYGKSANCQMEYL